MEFRHLRYFIAVAEELNITRAAKRLNVSQPPLSRQIRQLEEEVGVALFARDPKGVYLTPTGEIFLKESRRLVAHIEEVLTTVRRHKHATGGVVRVGIGAGLGAKFARAFQEHAHRFPGVDIQCRDVLSSHQSQALRNQIIDVGLLRPPIDSVHVISEYLFQESMMVLLPRRSPLAKHKALRLRQIADETLLLPERHFSSGMYEKMLEMFRSAAVDPKIVQTQTGAHEEAGIMLVEAGKGIFIIPAGLAHRCSSRGVAAISLSEPFAVLEVHMAWRRSERSPLVLELLNTLRNAFSRNAESGARHTLSA
jgi:DNA-binding transcriptional LysR family regulator